MMAALSFAACGAPVRISRTPFDAASSRGWSRSIKQPASAFAPRPPRFVSSTRSVCPLDTMKLSCQPVVVDGEELEGVRVAPARREDASQGVNKHGGGASERMPFAPSLTESTSRPACRPF